MLSQSAPVSVQHKPLRTAFNNGKLNSYLQDFYNFYLHLWLLSTNLVYPVNSNPISPNTKVSNMTFAEKLSNPCSLIDRSSLESVDSQHIPLSAIMQWMKAEIPEMNKTAEDILKANDLRMCTASRFRPDEKIPLAQNLSNNTTVDVVRLFYTSLLNHTAYVFFISEQIQKYSRHCSWDITLNRTRSLASKMQVLMCSFRNSAIALPGGTNDLLKDAHKQIFNEELTDISICSRGIFNVCLTLQNVLKILTELLCYLHTIS